MWRPASGICHTGHSRTAAATAKGQPYGVQVGAFRKQSQASTAAAQAMRRAPMLRGSFVSVGGTKQGKKIIYRALLLGLSKADADLACRKLKVAGQGCLVVRTGPLAMAQR